MRIEIKSWINSGVLFSIETESWKLAVEAAVKAGANLRDADLRDADLRDANLIGANLIGADLGGANLGGAKNIPEQYYRICRDDLWAVLSSAPMEVDGLKQALLDGKVDGSTYEGECACLVGTIANVKGCHFEKLPTLKPDANRPIERFFLAIQKGDTPKNNDFAKRAVEWIGEWQENMIAAFGGKK